MPNELKWSIEVATIFQCTLTNEYIIQFVWIVKSGWASEWGIQFKVVNTYIHELNWIFFYWIEHLITTGAQINNIYPNCGRATIVKIIIVYIATFWFPSIRIPKRMKIKRLYCNVCCSCIGLVSFLLSNAR